jgi:hypothetical protein
LMMTWPSLFYALVWIQYWRGRAKKSRKYDNRHILSGSRSGAEISRPRLYMIIAIRSGERIMQSYAVPGGERRTPQTPAPCSGKYPPPSPRDGYQIPYMGVRWGHTLTVFRGEKD